MARQKINDPLVDGQEGNFLIDKCELCGFVSYSVIARCPQCGNMILTSETTDKDKWVKGAVKEKLTEMRK